MSGSQLDIAVIGAGPIAEAHIAAFETLDGVAIRAIASRTKAKASALAERRGIPTVADSVDDLIALRRWDLIVVAVSVDAMRPMIESALTGATHVLAEKPLGLNLEDAKAVASAAASRDGMLWVGLNRRCYPATRAAVRQLASDPDPRLIDVFDQQDLEAAKRLGHSDEVLSNWMFANSIHLIDYFKIFCRGSIAAVEVVVPWKGRSSDLVMATLRFSSGDIGRYCAVWGRPGPWACAVTTKQRRIELRPLEKATEQLSGSRTTKELVVRKEPEHLKPGFATQAADIVSTIRGQNDGRHLASIAQALETSELVATIYQ